MAGLFDGLVKGLASLAPQDDPEIKKYNAQTELKEITEKENAIFAQIGREAYARDGAQMYPDASVQLNALAASRTQIQQRIEAAEAEKRAKEEAERRAREEAEARARAEAEAAALAASSVPGAADTSAAVTTCPSCGQVNAQGFKFCGSCGTKLPEPAPQKRLCSNCGAEVAPGMKFCSTCGTRQ